MAEKLDYDELIRKEREALMQKSNSGMFDSLARGAGLATRAVAPIVAGGAAGAAMGAPLMGVGAIPGAIAGATAAAFAEPLSDLAVSAYNYFTGSDQPKPSQAIDQLLTSAGVPAPESAQERLASTALRAGAETMTGARTARMAADALPQMSQVARPVMETLATQPALQTAASTIGGVTAQGALEAGAPPALALPAGAVAGSLPFMARPGNFFPNTGGEIRAANVRTLQDAGIPITPGQELGNPAAQVTESVMRYLPTSAPTVARVEDQQMRAWTRNLFKQAGIESDIATPEVLNKARQDFGKRYDALEAKTSLKGDGDLFNDLLQIEQNYVVGFPDTVKPTYKARVDEVLKYAAGEKSADGKTYHRLQSQLSEEIARANRSTEPWAAYYGEAMQGLQGALARAMERSAPEGLRDEWRTLNKQYAIFSRIEDTMARAGNDKLNTGFIPPQQIGAVERARNPRQWVEGGNDFTNLVRAGAGVLPDPVPNSGTAQRSFVQDLLTGGKRGAAAGAGYGAAQASGVTAIDPALALGLPYLVSKGWYAPRLRPEIQGLLGAQAIRGANEAD
jgi:hypothetical protein